MRTAACIVTYEPQIDLLERNVRAVSDQVDVLVIVDNGSSNVNLVSQVVPDSATFIPLGSNQGLAVAMNFGTRSASGQGAGAVFMLDQDSTVHSGVVAALVEDLAQNEMLAIAAAAFRDRNLDRGVEAFRGLEDADACITSGSLVRVEDWRRVRGWDETFFVDYVDFDFCLRLREAGRAIAIDHRCTLEHTIGAARKTPLGVSWGHSPQRLERMAGDVVHYYRKHRSTPRQHQVVPLGLVRATAMLAKKACLIVVFEDMKRAKIGALLKGYLVGLAR